MHYVTRLAPLPAEHEDVPQKGSPPRPRCTTAAKPVHALAEATGRVATSTRTPFGNAIMPNSTRSTPPAAPSHRRDRAPSRARRPTARSRLLLQVRARGQRCELARPMVRRRARFHADQARFELGEEAEHFGAMQKLSHDRNTRLINVVNPWKTCLAKSRPTVVSCSSDGSFECRRQHPSLWHADAAQGPSTPTPSGPQHIGVGEVTAGALHWHRLDRLP